jgi:hypothetical protein
MNRSDRWIKNSEISILQNRVGIEKNYTFKYYNKNKKTYQSSSLAKRNNFNKQKIIWIEL